MEAFPAIPKGLNRSSLSGQSTSPRTKAKLHRKNMIHLMTCYMNRTVYVAWRKQAQQNDFEGPFCLSCTRKSRNEGHWMKKKCWGFRKTGKPGPTWLTGSYAPGRDPARLENHTGSNQKQITQLVGRAATLEENIDYTLNIGGRTLKTDKLANKLIYNSLRNKVSKKPTAEIKRNLSNLSEIMT